MQAPIDFMKNAIDFNDLAPSITTEFTPLITRIFSTIVPMLQPEVQCSLKVCDHDYCVKITPLDNFSTISAHGSIFYSYDGVSWTPLNSSLMIVRSVQFRGSGFMLIAGASSIVVHDLSSIQIGGDILEIDYEAPLISGAILSVLDDCVIHTSSKDYRVPYEIPYNSQVQ